MGRFEIFVFFVALTTFVSSQFSEDFGDKYKLSWEVNATKIVFTAKVNGTGWVGIGLNDKEGFGEAEVMIGGWDERPPPTTAAPTTAAPTTAAPTTTAAPDTTTAAPDTTTAAPDTTTAAPDTTTAAPDTTTAAPDTTTAEPDTTTAEPDTTTAEPDTTTAEPMSDAMIYRHQNPRADYPQYEQGRIGNSDNTLGGAYTGSAWTFLGANQTEEGTAVYTYVQWARDLETSGTGIKIVDGQNTHVYIGYGDTDDLPGTEFSNRATKQINLRNPNSAMGVKAGWMGVVSVMLVILFGRM